MLPIALVLVPLLAGALAFAIPSNPARRALLVLTAAAHFGMTVAAWVRGPMSVWQGWLILDAPGLLFLGVTSLLFLATSLYGIQYLARESRRRKEETEEGLFFRYAPEASFTGCLLIFLSTMTLVEVSGHFGLLWVAIEATTLASAPLIYFHRHHRSLEAVWKYLLVCSVGIALALLGNFLLVVAASMREAGEVSLVLADLLRNAQRLDAGWLKVAFIFLFVGYGAKMGLVPMHTWLPDAHSEAPSMVSALLSGSLLNCALLGILRAQQVCEAAGLGSFGRELFILFGLLSIGLAAALMIRQADFKRMLAYSSIENMGIVSIGIGLGGAGVFAGFLHALNHSLVKAALFLLAGNLLTAFGAKSTARVRGALTVTRSTAALWLAGFFAIGGTPPFAVFFSKFGILKAAVAQGRFAMGALFMGLLLVVFLAMSGIVLRMAYGRPRPPAPTEPQREPALSIGPPAALLGIVLGLGIYFPQGLSRLLEEAARLLGGTP